MRRVTLQGCGLLRWKWARVGLRGGDIVANAAAEQDGVLRDVADGLAEGTKRVIRGRAAVNDYRTSGGIGQAYAETGERGFA